MCACACARVCVVWAPPHTATRQVAADAPASEIAAHLKKFTESLKAGITESEMSFEHTGDEGLAYKGKDVSGGYFGEFGGRYIPETLVEAHRWGSSHGSGGAHVRFVP